MDSGIGTYGTTSSSTSEEASLASREYPILPTGVLNEELPLVSGSEVYRRDGKSRLDICEFTLTYRGDCSLELLNLGIVIDDIVYDCTTFVTQHPGGASVVRSFAGKDCSCKFYVHIRCQVKTALIFQLSGQFHRIHGVHNRRKWLPSLRVGRTEGVKNPYPQPKT